MDDAEAALREMGRVVRPDGTILLLEHGRSHIALVNRYLDASACLFVCMDTLNG